MKTATATSAWLLDEGNRLDASFHLSDGREARAIIGRCPFQVEKVGNVTKEIFYGGRAKRNYVSDPEKGVPFIGSSDMLKSDLSGLKLLSKKYTKDLQSYFVDLGWTLISRSGTIGNTSYVTEDFIDKAASEHIIRVVPDENKIESGYLFAFFSTKYGYALLTQGTFGAVIQHIEPHHITDLPIPLLPERQRQEIHGLVEEAARLRVEGNGYLRTAKNTFETKFDKVQREDKFRVKSVSINRIQDFQDRVDAHFHLNEIEIENALAKSGLKFMPLQDLLKVVFIPNRGKRNYVKKGVRYLSTSDLTLQNPTRVTSFLSAKSAGIESMKVKNKWIIVARSGQEILGTTFYIGERLEGDAVNEHGLRLLVDEGKIQSEYVFAYLATAFGRKYLRTGIFGSAILTINEDFINRVKIPILPEAETSAVVELVRKYQKNYEEAITKENQAITILENEISSWQPSKQPYTATLR